MKLRYYFLYLFVALFVWEIFGVFHYANSLSKFKNSEIDFKDIDMIVVLTGSVGRLDTAYKLFKENNVKTLLISGVGEKVSFDILARKYSWDIDLKDKIFLDAESKTTLDNARFTASKILEYDYKNICVVSSLTHMKRAYFIFSEVLDVFDVSLSYYSSSSNELDSEVWWKDFKIVKTVFEEYIKYEYYKFLMFFKI